MNSHLHFLFKEQRFGSSCRQSLNFDGILDFHGEFMCRIEVLGEDIWESSI